MNQTRRLALTDLMDTAARLKANAVTGVDIDGGPHALHCRVGQALKVCCRPAGDQLSRIRERGASTLRVFTSS